MKYMGSKRYMLSNGLGVILNQYCGQYTRFVDLFTGSAVVSSYVARNFDVTVLANDLQSFSASLAEAVVGRTIVTDPKWIEEWLKTLQDSIVLKKFYFEAARLQQLIHDIEISKAVAECREYCDSTDFPVTKAYGGYYFSPLQALIIDHCRAHLPKLKAHKAIALSSIIQAASVCSASPGHTAQPFKANSTAGPFLIEAWSRDPFGVIRSRANELCGLHAKRRGAGVVGDANILASTLNESDLAFIDPPYSGVHYSRFYHVLETVNRGMCVDVSGEGRYPPALDRPNSEYSKRTTSKAAMRNLLETLQGTGASAIITYPANETSNGLHGSDVLEIANELFNVRESCVSGRFSTLGGNLINRTARIASNEMVLLLTPN